MNPIVVFKAIAGKVGIFTTGYNSVIINLENSEMNYTGIDNWRNITQINIDNLTHCKFIAIARDGEAGVMEFKNVKTSTFYFMGEHFPVLITSLIIKRVENKLLCGCNLIIDDSICEVYAGERMLSFCVPLAVEEGP